MSIQPSLFLSSPPESAILHKSAFWSHLAPNRAACMKPLLSTLSLLILKLSLPAAEPVDYLRDIKPLLAKHCGECHGAEKQRAGLRLDSAAALRAGGNSGPVVVAGKSGESLLIRAVTGAGEVKVMPPKEPRLSPQQIDLLRAWIDAGATAPQNETVAAGTVRSKHWAFQPLVRAPLPSVRHPAWVRNPVDHFVLARLEKEGIAPSPEAERATLLRRVSFDLIGLPPTLEEIDAFVNDKSPDAYEQVVDRLLASPHYGERWGRHWLDQARYADSNGYSIDGPRSIWKYRDWVIDAFNRDLPFNQFTIEQLAGDLLPGATIEQKVATGFHRNTPINQEGGIDLEQFRVESVIDRVNTTGAVFLGLTVGCAQCHDHKYDPLSQREYYQLFAFLNNQDEPTLDVAAPDQLRMRDQHQTRLKQLQQQLDELDPLDAMTEDRWEKRLSPEMRQRFPVSVQKLLELPENGRTPKQKDVISAAFRKMDQTRHVAAALGQTPAAALVHLHALTRRQYLDKEVARLKRIEPAVVTTMVLQERKTPRKTHVHLGGDFLRPGVAVQPGVPAVLPPLPTKEGPANRLDLARWLVQPEHPLTSRVLVNRFWQVYFGAGLVETENDFGIMGTPPSHPELLDWLATELVRQGWSMKALHRILVTSATYRQSSRTRPDLKITDPRNRLLARQTRLRLEAEVIRDVALAASGQLSPKIGGPSVFPPQPDGVYRFTQVPRDWKPDGGADRYRRGIYTHLWRSALYPALTVFDAPEATTACTRRNRSNTPLQALTLLNDQAFHELAQGLTTRLLRDSNLSDRDRIRLGFRLCLGRLPQPIEERTLLKLLTDSNAVAVGKGGQADRTATADWMLVARVLLNLDEFITRE